MVKKSNGRNYSLFENKIEMSVEYVMLIEETYKLNLKKMSLNLSTLPD